MSPRLAHGQALLTTRRYLPGSTGHPDEPSAVTRSVNALGARTNSVVSVLTKITPSSVAVALYAGCRMAQPSPSTDTIARAASPPLSMAMSSASGTFRSVASAVRSSSSAAAVSAVRRPAAP